MHASTLGATTGAALVAVADAVESAARVVAETHGCEIRTIEAIEGAPDVDAVVICTPTDTHADLIERFCRAGKAVFCEKPVDLEAARARQVMQTVATTGGRLMVGFQRRFDPDFRALKAVIDRGEIGEVEMVHLISRDPGAPPHDYIRRSGGIFQDMTIHDFDVARWLLGEEVETVMAQASVLTDGDIEKLGDYDSANVLLRTSSGKLCTISNSRRASYGYDQRIEVHGSLGAVSAGNHRQADIELATGSGYTRPPLLDFFMTRYTAAYAAEMTAFVAALSEGGPMPTTGEDGVRALELAEAALASVRTGAEVRVGEEVPA
ncbi:IdhA, myo-inositol 2-dehydrogenase [Oceanicola granulosus HTCC2516]|uniref:IdhA, myo-inositol 2-dehydrogenase n=1 Tax=Oceanicola granulosus (strain ATCC BAA-861 / DSM 15982 / KCTC 12143 / HTCC2516) TaxID=314256 RepID=Q2CEM9_OCEGH|nr:IdhA, myo-inositol 2-dehydrogenase [Oceanicola granulosus HTCC2516]